MRNLFLFLIFMMLCGVAMGSAPTLYDDPDMEPIARHTLPDSAVVGFIYISFHDHPDTVLDSDLLTDFPAEFDNCFNTQSHGAFHIESRVITHIDPSLSGLQWIADSTYTAYKDSLVHNYVDYRTEFRGEVAAEIIFKIQQEYQAHGASNPLLECDYLNIVHQQSLQRSGLGGQASTYLKLSEFSDDTLNRDMYGGFTTFQQFSSGGEWTRSSLKTVYQHEFGHVIGLGGHMPSDSTFTYGIYAPMRTSVIHNVGFIPFHPLSLERLGWLESIDVASEQTFVLADAQLVDGNAARVRLGEMGGLFDNEILYLTYHSGIGYAAKYPSQGLAVWHCYEGSNSSYPVSCDMEQAAGRWDDPVNQIGYNPVSGSDLFDYPYAGHPGYYQGDESDLFSVSIGDTTIISYDTNPTTYGGATDTRHADQSVPMSLMILAEGLTETTVSVKVIPAPRAEITSPTVDSTIAENDSLQFTWGVGDFDQIIDEVQLWFSVDGGDYYYMVASGDYEEHSLHWDAEPRSRWATTDGRYYLTFGNTVSATCSGISESPAVLTVAGTVYPWEEIITPDEGDVLYTGVPYDIVWTNRHGANVTRVDFAYSVDAGDTWSAWDDSILCSPQDSVNVFEWQPTDDAVTDGLNVRLRYHSSAGTAVETSTNDAIVYPLGVFFTDFTDSTSTPTFSGTASSVVPIVADGDPTSFDLIVGVQAALPGNTGKYFSNASTYSGALDFEDRTFYRFPSGIFEPGFGALAVADFDGDGLDDLFACRPDKEASQLFWNNGNSFESANSTALGSIASQDLWNATCASWIDVDHDGDLDLYIGRGSESDARKDLLLIYDDEAGEFEDQSANSGLVDPSDPVATTSIAWADIDGDGRLEVVKAGEGRLQLFRQIASTEFEEVSGWLPAGMPVDDVRCLRWLDFDRDNDLDLLVVRTTVGSDGAGTTTYKAAQSYVVYNNSGQFDAYEVVIATESLEAGTLDWNLDGWVDILIPPVSISNRAALIANFQGLPDSYPSPNSTFERFIDVGAPVGLGETGQAFGSFAGDMNGDGDPDILMGRTGSADGTWYQGARQDTTLSNSNWLGVLLSSPYRDGEYSATVVLEDGSSNPLGAQIVDAGGSAGGQQARKLVFGLGEYNSNLVVKVYWPGGRVQEEPIGSGSINTSIVVVEDDEFEIDESSVYCELEFDPYTITYDWVFRWETNHWTPSGDDTVYLTHDSGSGCESMPRTLQDTGPSDSIEASVVFQVDGTTGSISYLHELRWNGRSCLPSCYYNYEVRSELGTTTDSYDPSSGTYSIVKFPKLCPQ